MSSFDVLVRLFQYVKSYKLWTFLALIGLVISTALSVAIPNLLQGVIDQGVASGNTNYMLSAGLLVILLGFGRGVVGFFFRYYSEKMSHFIAYDMRNALYNKVQNQSFTYHDNSQTGTLITRAISDVSEVQRFYAYGVIDGLSTILLLIFAMTSMLLTSPILALITFIPLVPLAFFSKNFAQSVDPRWKKIMDRLQILGNYIQENALGAEVVRAFAREDHEIKKFKTDNQLLYHEQIALVSRWGSYIPLSTFIIAFSTALLLLVGSLMESAGMGGITVGLIVSFNAYVLLMAMPIRFLGFAILIITQGLSSARRVFEIMDAPEEVVDASDAKSIQTFKGDVRFEDVTLTYKHSTQPALKNIHLEAKAGEVIALIGATGAGKTSLVSLIPRFYDVTSGRVTIDGIDVRDMKLDELRHQVGFVLQQSLLFSASVAENIAYGNPNATMEQIIAAAKAADAHNFIMDLAEGYDTPIGERGITLSGGQKQRIAIARAILIDPRILILDDATSSVDTRTEFSIREALSKVMEGRTTFIIAQRLNSVQNADQILVLKEGEIVERGKHEELLALKGYYAQIYDLQLADQERARRELADFSKLKKHRANDNLITEGRTSAEEHRKYINQAGN